MTRAEIFENRRDVGKKICRQIRENNGRMINTKFFPARPYCDGVKNYKFRTANYLIVNFEEKYLIGNFGSLGKIF